MIQELRTLTFRKQDGSLIHLDADLENPENPLLVISDGADAIVMDLQLTRRVLDALCDLVTDVQDFKDNTKEPAEVKVDRVDDWSHVARMYYFTSNLVSQFVSDLAQVMYCRYVTGGEPRREEIEDIRRDYIYKRIGEVEHLTVGQQVNYDRELYLLNGFDVENGQAHISSGLIRKVVPILEVFDTRHLTQ